LNLLSPSVQPQSFLKWIRTSFEQSLAEFYTFFLEEHLQVAVTDVLDGKVFLTLSKSEVIQGRFRVLKVDTA
jgi:hypothetical protein